jgi:hypothetical protein
VIAFFATNRALYLFVRSLATKRPLAWEKTKHTFPESEYLAGTRRTLGSLLLEQNLITPAALETVLALQKRDGRRLGEILVSSGLITEEPILKVLAAAAGISVGEVDPFQTGQALLEEVPYPLAMAHAIFPIDRPQGRLLLATDRPISPPTVTLLEQVLGQALTLVLVKRSELAYAIEHRYLPAPETESDLRLTARLVAEQVILPEQAASLWRQLRTGYPRLDDLIAESGSLSIAALVRDLVESPILEGERLADYLLRRRLSPPSAVESALAEQQKRTLRISDMLIRGNFCSRETLERMESTL